MSSSKKLPTKALEFLAESGEIRSALAQEKKLTDDQQMELIEYIAKFTPNQKIIERFFTHHQIMLSSSLIYQYRRTPKWQPVIKKFREKYVGDTAAVAGMHKRVRLERADEIYEKAINSGKLRIALAANKDQREEVFEKSQTGNTIYTVNQFNQFNNMSDEELEAKRTELLSKIKKVEVISES